MNPAISPKLHSGRMEVAIAQLLNPRVNIIVPNVYWGWGLRHEADLISVNKNMYVTEVEIKISVSDLKADFTKGHCHESKRIHRLVYAVPESMVETALQLIPGSAGLISVRWNGRRYEAKWLRQGKKNRNNPISMNQLNDLLRLASMRIWSLKTHNYSLKN